MQIAALFVAKGSIYKSFDFIDCYDVERDAMSYRGTLPVIAHPPCQLWGNMAYVNYARWGGEHNRPGNDGGKFKFALSCVNRCGGVIEHPKNSRAWSDFELVKPQLGKWTRSGMGWVCEVWQSAYGHRANKATWLYYVGNTEPKELRWERPTGSHQVGFYDQRGKEKNKPTLSKREANATPIGFALELIKMVRPVLKIGPKKDECGGPKQSVYHGQYAIKTSPCIRRYEK